MIVNKLKIMEILGRIPIFQHLKVKERQRIADMPKAFKIFSTGESIIVEGTQDPNFYILLSGEANVSHKGHTVGKLKPPQFIGEVGFICREPRTATVIASNRVVAMKLDSENFRELPMNIRESVKDKIIAGLVGRINQFNKRVVEINNLNLKALNTD